MTQTPRRPHCDDSQSESIVTAWLESLGAYLIQRVYIDGVPEEDMAVAVGISLEGIRKRLQEARRKLRKERKTEHEGR